MYGHEIQFGRKKIGIFLENEMVQRAHLRWYLTFPIEQIRLILCVISLALEFREYNTI